MVNLFSFLFTQSTYWVLSDLYLSNSFKFVASDLVLLLTPLTPPSVQHFSAID